VDLASVIKVTGVRDRSHARLYVRSRPQPQWRSHSL